MKINRKFAKILGMALIFWACDTKENDSNKEEFNYKIASPVYITLTEKSLDYLSSFEFESFAEMLADSVEYELPNGEKLIGKTALINFWKVNNSTLGIKSMKITNANYLPLDATVKLKKNDYLGIKVVADFENNMIFKDRNISVKMNFNFHFNQQKLIDQINTNYDQTLINKVYNCVL